MVSVDYLPVRRSLRRGGRLFLFIWILFLGQGDRYLAVMVTVTRGGFGLRDRNLVERVVHILTGATWPGSGATTRDRGFVESRTATGRLGSKRFRGGRRLSCVASESINHGVYYPQPGPLALIG